MLEYALRMERSVYLFSLHDLSTSPIIERSKQLTQPTSHSTPSTKLLTIQGNASSLSQKDDSHSQKEDSGGSSPRSEGMFFCNHLKNSSCLFPVMVISPLLLDSPLPDGRLPNGGSINGPSGKPNYWGSTNWSNLPASGTIAGLGKPPLGKDPKSRARSRDYLKQYVVLASYIFSPSTALLPHCIRCLQEINYLTSPQAMNPLPNRPLLNNPPAPLSLPNIPSFDQIPYNGRPRKVLPEAGKEFPLLNGLSSMSGSISSPGPQLPILGRSSPLASVMVQQQTPLSQLPSPASTQASSSNSNQDDKDRDYQSENRQTAIFRPDDAGEWKEKLRLAHEASEKARLTREFQTGTSSDPGIWDRHGEEEEVKEDEGEVEDEETTLGGDGEGIKLWKAKRTLRKLVSPGFA